MLRYYVIYRRTLKVVEVWEISGISLREFNPISIYDRKISNWISMIFHPESRQKTERQLSDLFAFSFCLEIFSTTFSKFRKFSNEYNVWNDSKFFFSHLYARVHIYFLKHNFITISIAIFLFPAFSTNINTRENIFSFFLSRAHT